MRAIKLKFIAGPAVVAIVIVALLVALFLPASFPYRTTNSVVEFRIEKGDSLGRIADNLKAHDLIRSTFLFKSYAAVLAQNRNLKAGLYKLSYSMSISDLVRIFSSGLYESEDISVTIPEGANINDFDIILAKAGLTKAGQFLAGNVIGQEGYLFPDTYNFLPGIAFTDIISEFRENFRKKTAAVFGSKDLAAGETVKAVIIGSILEKEVQTKEDMAIVAGIIENRLNRQMPLQIDATVAYGVCRKSFLMGKRCDVSQVNLIDAIKRDDPFNTYRNKGLPPGPISNPGVKAVYAALNPAKTDYLYYLTDKDGNVHYARTSAEHQQNRAKYLR